MSDIVSVGGAGTRFVIALNFVFVLALPIVLSACGREASHPNPGVPTTVATPTAARGEVEARPEDDMDTTVRLDLENPVAAAGAPAGVWIADSASNTVTRFDPATGNLLSVISLEAAPVDVEVIGDNVVVGLTDGSIVMYEMNSADEVLRRSVVSGDLSLRSASDRIWVLDREVPAFIAFDLAGNRRALQSDRVFAFAAGSDGVYWISDDGLVHFGGGEIGDRIPARLPGDPSQIGAMVVCANSLWVSVPDGLLMVSLRSLSPGNTLPAPEGSVPHLICDQDNRIIGGGQGVFVLDPAVDDTIRAVGVAPKSELRALVAAGDRIWALESTEPTAHILQIP